MTNKRMPYEGQRIYGLLGGIWRYGVAAYFNKRLFVRDVGSDTKYYGIIRWHPADVANTALDRLPYDEPEEELQQPAPAHADIEALKDRITTLERRLSEVTYSIIASKMLVWNITEDKVCASAKRQEQEEQYARARRRIDEIYYAEREREHYRNLANGGSSKIL